MKKLVVSFSKTVNEGRLFAETTSQVQIGCENFGHCFAREQENGKSNGGLENWTKKSRSRENYLDEQ
jgi:hypothetical protein